MLLDFYLKLKPNCDGLTLDNLLSWSNEELEYSHDVIQWLFPTITESSFNPDAPILTERDIHLWKANPQLQSNLRESFERYLTFLGLEYKDDQLALTNKKQNVWCGLNHNWLRITRDLNCLSLLGLKQEAKCLFECLEKMYESGEYQITEEVFSYWKKAIE